MAADDHAVVVGITRYPSFEELRGPENDAEAVCDWLTDSSGGAVPSENVAKIVSSKFRRKPGRPKTEQVYDAFDELIALGEKRDPKPAGRRLYIFFAGHGFGPSLREAALLMANAAPRRPGYHVNAGAVADYFAQSGYFREVVLFVDCCRDDLGSAKLGALPWLPVPGAAAGVRWLYAYATGWSRKARERTFDNGTVRGVFTVALLDALRSGAGNSTMVTNVVRARMLELSDPNDHQEPIFQPGPAEIQFGPAAVKPTLRVTLKPRGGGGTVTIGHGDGKSPFAKRKLAEGEDWTIELDSGLYEVGRTDTGESELIKITAGEQHVEI